jgi:hypothetical protein
MSRYKDISNKKFGRLTAVKKVGKDDHGNSKWLCNCKCGEKTIVIIQSLTSGNTKSCGCLKNEIFLDNITKHGKTKRGHKNRLHNIWKLMRQRCSNPNASKYEIYGGKGIKVCDEWQVYINFHNWAIANGYKDNLTLDRIENDGDYCPENCRWATYKEQNLNTSSNNKITFRGITKTITQWGRELEVNYMTLYGRLSRGWSVEKTFTEPIRGRENEGSPIKNIKTS